MSNNSHALQITRRQESRVNFPGDNSMTLSSEALCAAVEGALNAARRDGEDYIRVTEISQGYSYGPYKLTITTDPAPKPEAVQLREVA